MMFLDRGQRLARPLAGGVFLRFSRLPDGDFLDDGWAGSLREKNDAERAVRQVTIKLFRGVLQYYGTIPDGA